MRAVKAKRLRKIARGLTKGKEASGHVVQRHTRMIKIDVTDRSKSEKYTALQIRVDPQTTRGVYRQLKEGTYDHRI